MDVTTTIGNNGDSSINNFSLGNVFRDLNETKCLGSQKIFMLYPPNFGEPRNGLNKN